MGAREIPNQCFRFWGGGPHWLNWTGILARHDTRQASHSTKKLYHRQRAPSMLTARSRPLG